MHGRGAPAISWQEYFAGRLHDNNGPDGAPRFNAVMASRFADDADAHAAYGEAMKECFARGEPVQGGAEHAWSRYQRERV